MKKKLLFVAATTVLAGSAMAQSAFEGFYGQIGVGYESVSPSFSGGTVVTTPPNRTAYTASSDNSNSFTGNVGLGYNFALSPGFLLGIGAEYTPIAGSSANFTVRVPAANVSSTDSWKKSNSYNVFLAPGIVIDKDKLVYVKVGYTGMSVKSGSDTTNYTGMSAGLGYKQMISGSLYGFAEVNYAKYGDQNLSGTGITGTSNANVTNALVGIGYKF
jgi:opacity protein-like surface antigen